MTAEIKFIESTATERMYKCIEAERARCGLTISELAEKLSVNEKTYRNWKDNNKPLDSIMIAILMQTFDCSADYLLGFSNTIKS